MIPHKLQLKNFLSYGPEAQNVDFSPYHLICLSGKNGHGKSALLDAITWAIWGQARKTSGNSKADQGLLHLGQNHMFVIIEFEVNGQTYRIRREYVETKSKPFTSLDFGVMQEDKKFAALTDKTIKATQSKIEKTIGITYDSFISSAFLRQGQSNEFSKKSPKERKEVLAQILQLQQFDDQKKIAQLQAKKLHVEFKSFESIQQRVENELEQLATITQDYQTVQNQLTKLTTQKKTLEKEKQTFIAEQKKVAQQTQEYELLQHQQKQAALQLEQTKKSIQTTALEWHKNHALLQNHGNHKQLELEEKKLSAEIKQQQELLQKKLVFREEYLKIKEELSHQKNLLEKQAQNELQHIQLELSKLQAQHSQQLRQLEQFTTQQKAYQKEFDLQSQELHATTTLLKQHEPSIKQYQQYEEDFETIKSNYQKTCTQGMLIKEQTVTLQNLLNKQDNTSCPLCKQTLSKNGYDSVKHEYEQLQQKLEVLKKSATTLKQDLIKSQATLQEIKKQHEASINLQSKKIEQQKSYDKLAKQAQELEASYKALQAEEQTTYKALTSCNNKITHAQKTYQNIHDNKHIKSFEKQLQEIEAKAKALKYDQNYHKKCEQQLLDIQQKVQAVNNITELTTQQTERKAELFSFFKTAYKYDTLYKEIKQQLDLHHDPSIAHKKLQEQEKHLENTYKSIEKEQTSLLIQKGSLEQKQQKQKDLHKERAKLTKQIKAVQQEMIDYQEIAKALGKDGIQALLIEQAIPEIEDEANEVLARLTNNQTQVFIESLRDLKKGGCKETLDIKISDSFGLRDYELFSGGEAFRIDFALRIGISKLLARKAGTTLQTIIIDEGFGSQDEEGLQLIMDNIYKIQDEFAKVIVVSHLPEMKENFPVQFIVEKKRSGSSISIIEQG